MAEMQNLNEKDALMHKYYILMKERQAKKEHTKAYSSSHGQKGLLKGEILVGNVKTCVDSTKGTIRLHPYDKTTYFSDCPVGEVHSLEDEEARLLLSFKSNDERYKFFVDSSLHIGKKMTIGTHVFVKVRSSFGGSSQEVRGIIRYKGPLPGEHGTMFGVELLEGRGRGTTNGYFKAQRFFMCDNDCGIFVSLEKLRLCEDKKDMNASEDKKDMNASEDKKDINASDDNLLIRMKNKVVEGFTNIFPMGELSDEKSLAIQDSYMGHKPGDIVWVFINDKKPHPGIIRYIGRVPGEDGIYAGIEMGKPIGQGNGEYNGKQLFKCHMDHAHFTPVEFVMFEENYLELYEHEQNSKGTSDSSESTAKPSSTPPKTSKDILKMESDFAKESEDAIINQQEKILKQIEKQKLAEKKQVEKNGFGGGEKPLDEQWKKENRSKVNNHVSQLTLEMNKQYIKEPQISASTNQFKRESGGISSQNELDIGSMVEVLSKNTKAKYGVIRWVGFAANSEKKIAGLELEEEMEACTDGTFLGKRYFTCPPRRGFFVHLHNCLPDSRFQTNSMEKHVNKRLTGTDFGPYKSPKIPDDRFIPPPETLDIYISKEARGIQGHHNSCYLDATLFAAFAFSSVMDAILLRPRNDDDINDYEKVQTVLRNNIIYPLRHYGFVRADRVFELREHLDRLGTVTGLVGEEKDPEEFLSTLFRQVLKTEPFLKLKSGNEVHNEYLYQVLAVKDAERVLPSVEEILKRSFHQNNLKLAEVPSCLIVQMPRFGKQYKMYGRILPSLTINIGELVDNAPQDCAVCGRLAKYHCRECFSITGFDDNDSSGNFCLDCNKRQHSHVKRTGHKFQPLNMSREICQTYMDRAVEHRDMELFAIICIETSHYVTFAKCQEPDGEVKWCFFDSMADRVGTKNGYNVPSVTECPEVIEWLSSEKQNRERIINTNDKDLPDRVRRILGDAYVCLYQSKEMSMYK
ncbi:ubiquitin carboxyl-terminal hydrolase CYLD-like [Dendronephthya gigantea]|uniref:ubiquitin carboxyl-terminal hydrolase CYLD-like n=1 Tax=Dendronephthya gigantea TaxID=151771 RepID=UPI00106DB001|nr:ubiquitin carboxyl-terminal hydrolase CYLD-like [Dendronephthya gigantea]